jgi:hypothetical protein
MHSVYGDKCIGVSIVRRGVRQLKQEGCSPTVVSGERKGLFLRTEFKTLLTVGKSVLKLEEIMWNSDYAQL